MKFPRTGRDLEENLASYVKEWHNLFLAIEVARLNEPPIANDIKMAALIKGLRNVPEYKATLAMVQALGYGIDRTLDLLRERKSTSDIREPTKSGNRALFVKNKEKDSKACHVCKKNNQQKATCRYKCSICNRVASHLSEKCFWGAGGKFNMDGKQNPPVASARTNAVYSDESENRAYCVFGMVSDESVLFDPKEELLIENPPTKFPYVEPQQQFSKTLQMKMKLKSKSQEHTSLWPTCSRRRAFNPRQKTLLWTLGLQHTYADQTFKEVCLTSQYRKIKCEPQTTESSRSLVLGLLVS